MILKALELSGQRGILLSGWAGIGEGREAARLCLQRSAAFRTVGFSPACPRLFTTAGRAQRVQAFAQGCLQC